MTDTRRGELLTVVDAAQRVTGVLAARHRGDAADARDLMATFTGEDELAGGAMLVAELSLRLYAAESGRQVEDCLRELSLQMEAAVRRA